MKQGILHDYDLQANAEAAACREHVCAVCGSSPITFQWSDRSGEAMCVNCGCIYQLKWGSEEQEKEGAYPYLLFLNEFIPVAREYWKEKHIFVCHGTMLGPKPGWREFLDWLKEKHPEWLEPRP